MTSRAHGILREENQSIMQTNHIQKCSFRLALLAVSCLFLQSAGVVQAQIQDRPKPGPEHLKLAAWVGEWTYEGVLMDTPLGPGGKFVGHESVRWILDGLFLEFRDKDKGVYGGKESTYEGVIILWYDPVAKTYKVHSFDNDGFVGMGVVTHQRGSDWTASGTGTNSKGKTTKTRHATTFSFDGKTRTSKCEISLDDGKTWSTYYELTMKKVKE